MFDFIKDFDENGFTIMHHGLTEHFSQNAGLTFLEIMALLYGRNGMVLINQTLSQKQVRSKILQPVKVLRAGKNTICVLTTAANSKD